MVLARLAAWSMALAATVGGGAWLQLPTPPRPAHDLEPRSKPEGEALGGRRSGTGSWTRGEEPADDAGASYEEADADGEFGWGSDGESGRWWWRFRSFAAECVVYEWRTLKYARDLYDDGMKDGWLTTLVGRIGRASFGQHWVIVKWAGAMLGALSVVGWVAPGVEFVYKKFNPVITEVGVWLHGPYRWLTCRRRRRGAPTVDLYGPGTLRSVTKEYLNEVRGRDDRNRPRQLLIVVGDSVARLQRGNLWLVHGRRRRVWSTRMRRSWGPLTRGCAGDSRRPPTGRCICARRSGEARRRTPSCM